MIEIKTAVLALTVAATGVAGLGALRAHASHGGGHGWHGDVFGDIRAGIEWLEGQVKGNASAK